MYLTSTVLEGTDRLINLINETFPTPDYENWSSCKRISLHSKAVANLIIKHNIETEGASHLLHEMTCFLNETGIYQ